MCTYRKVDINQFEEWLKKWNEIQSIDELNERYRKCKLFVIKTAEDFEERKAFDLLAQDYYLMNLKRLENNSN